MKPKTSRASTGHGTGALVGKPPSWNGGKRSRRFRLSTRAVAPWKARRAFYRQREQWRGMLKEYTVAGHLRGLSRAAGRPGKLVQLVAGGAAWVLERGAKLRAAIYRLKPVHALRVWWRGQRSTAEVKREVKAAERFVRGWNGNPRVQSYRERIAKGELTVVQVPAEVHMGASRDTVRKWARAELARQGLR